MLLVCKPTQFAASRRHPLTVQSVPHRPPSFNLRFSPNLRLSRYSLKCTAKYFQNPKSDELAAIQIIQSNYNYEDPTPTPPPPLPRIWIFVFVKQCAIGLVMMAVLLMSAPICSWAASGGRMGGRAFQSSPSSTFSLSSRSTSSPSSTPRLRSSSSSSSTEDYQHVEDNELTIGMFIVALLPILGPLLSSLGYVCEFVCEEIASADWEKTSVLKLQVGLLGTARSLQTHLDRIAKTAHTSTTMGLSHMLTETTLALMRHPNYCISAYSCAHFNRSIKEGEKQFDRLSIEERAKFNEETLVNMNSILTHRPSSLPANGLNNEYIVVTILVAIQGNHMMPTIKGSEDLKNALQTLKSIPISQIRAVEVLWTPQAKNDTLSEKEFIEDYPHLVPLYKD